MIGSQPQRNIARSVSSSSGKLKKLKKKKRDKHQEPAPLVTNETVIEAFLRRIETGNKSPRSTPLVLAPASLPDKRRVRRVTRSSSNRSLDSVDSAESYWSFDETDAKSTTVKSFDWACSSHSNISDQVAEPTTDNSSSEASRQHKPSHLVQVRDKPRWNIHDSVVDVIGQTPIIRLQRLVAIGYSLNEGVNVYVKCENMNPGGSVKDRLAFGIIEWAEQSGELLPGQTVIEASSGNTGVGLAMVCAARGYPFVCVMSEAFSTERRQMMRYLGARVVLTPAAHKATGMLLKAQSLADQHGFFYAQQFESEANAWIHEQTTGVEIAEAFEEQNMKLDHLFLAYGTGGTVLGVSRALRKLSPSTKIHLCEPVVAPMMQSGIPTTYPKRDDPRYKDYPTTAFETTHPVWNPHIFQGWATDFIPKLADKAKKESSFQYVEHVAARDAIRIAHHLAATEGIFVGISGGGILAAALTFAERADPGTNILAILTDTAERYLSTSLFADIPTEMTEDERALSDSTPNITPRQSRVTSAMLPKGTDELFDV